MKSNLLFKIFIGMLFMMMMGCATTPRYVDTTLSQGDVTLQQLCDLYDIEWHWDSFSQVITLNNHGVETVAMVGSDVVLVGEEEIHLSQPLERKKSMIIVPPDFHEKVIGPYHLSTVEVEKFVDLDDTFDHKVKRFKKIIIDPGHGDKDPGALGKMGTKEKDVVLDVSKRLAYILEDYGINIVMTRSTDRFISLAKRTEIASRSDADLFISIHANASPARSANGFEVYYLRNLDQSGKNEDQRRKNEHQKFSDLNMDRNSGQVKSIVSDLLYAHKQTLSPDLAQFIAHQTARDIRSSNRGEKQAGFYVLRNTLIPAILVEIGFLSNPQEEKMLRSSHHRQKIAESIAKNILSYDGQF